MNLNPHLGRTDRIANLLGGAGMVVYAFLKLDDPVIRVVAVVLGLVLVVSGIGGT
ncbi:MAG: hypothetical protein DHS20C21_24220 [Gemmatimonadota bacterium]|nr:MAG: hypothetical protein DHS20C21_24220 [Gemmatimonadota bacterium]